MQLLLHIETAGQNCSVALSNENGLIDCIEKNEANIHGSALTVFIETLLAKNNLKPIDLKAVAVSKGPGSYTGLRIGVSTAKGLCYALNIPLIATDTLGSLANMALSNMAANANEKFLLCPMLDARRMEVYTCLYDQDLNLITKVSASIIDENSFAEYRASQPIYFFGDGAEKCKPIFANDPHSFFIDNLYPSASASIAAAHAKFEQNMVEDVAYFEPFYLKEFLFHK